MNHTSPNPSRREVLAGLAGLSLTALGALRTRPAQAAAAFGAGGRSKLSWHSGCAISKHADFAAYRGRPIDTITTWCPWQTWSDITGFKGGFRTAKSSGARISLALPALPASHSGYTDPKQWLLAAKGTYDQNYRDFARKLRESGVTDVVCRVGGWECNNRGRPWYCGTADPAAYRETLARIATIVRAENPTVLTEWCNIKKGAQPGSIMNYYPGDAYIDILGVNYYDGWPAQNDDTTWNGYFMSEHNGGPRGIGRWIAEAKSRGKLFACSEWGISVGISPGAGDNDFYIRKMHETFSANASVVAYENYFNQKVRHQLTPTDANPKASKMYKSLWGV